MTDEADTEPRLHVALDASSPDVLLTRRNVDDRVWWRVALHFGTELPRGTAPMRVRSDTFLRYRIGLQGILAEAGVGLRADDEAVNLLARWNHDERALRDLIARGDRNDIEDEAESLYDAMEGMPVLCRELRQFQRRDLHRLSGLPHGANFSVPGAGKTTVTYALHVCARRNGLVDKLLVIAPLSAFGAWEEDGPDTLRPAPRVARWRGGAVPSCDVLLVNYQRLAAAVPALTAWMRRNRTHLVVDEAHRAKRGASGEWGRSLLTLAPLAVRRDVLTGTPAPNQPRDLAALLDILWPGGGASSLLPQAAFAQDPPATAMTQVNRVIRPLYVRTTKSELNLPPVRIVRDPVPLGALQQQIYDALLSRYAGMFDLDRRDAAMFAQMGEVTMYLLQAASSPRLLASAGDPARAYRYPPLAIPPGSRLARLVDTYADHEVPAKIERACRLVHANAAMDRKTLVWSNFPDNLLDLEQQLAALQPALVYGAVVSDEAAAPGVRTRERELERFRDDESCRALLANPAALAEGVSLHHACHDAIYIDRTFNAGQYLQSLDRIHRLGLRDDTETRVTVLLSRGTIDERVDRRVHDKTRRLARMLDDRALVQMALPDEEEAGFAVDEDADLVEILEHLANGLPQAGAEVG